ncbi:hypothetical protein N7462_001245 [Penicillium macrosclerotiorum]|uniref:uncharacterized protein n=1 Tax=Penicillium macrosclerotiorum TaxID=303699 RepID=UPI00254837B7|nr:uncharacterized protein N7462_001245 [Penicillium macrosclerotiorum]KAJ5691822.1 hypothetical protein N7462_001245 [Penicillium macrosclerotiorum]
MGESQDNLFNIWTYDKAGKTKITDRIVIGSIKEDATLADIRASLVKSKLDSKKALFPFCTKDGARIGDDSKWQLYKELTAGATESSGNGDDENPAEEATEKNDTPALSIAAYDVYFELDEEETNRKYGELGANVQKLLDTPLNLELGKDKVNLLKANIADFKLEGYDHAQWKSIASTTEPISAGSLSDADWDMVCRATHFLNGHRMVFLDTAGGRRKFQRIDKAPYPAFSIKARSLEEMGMSGPNVTLPTEDPILYKYPLYTVTDDSYVNVFETANALSNSLASSNFSSMDIEASIGGGLFGYSAAAKGGFSKSETDALATSEQSKHRSMNITYNFPRVVLHLDNDSLELTKSCKDALDNIIKLRRDPKVASWQERKALIKFYQKFGHFFATNVELGGKLFSKEEFSSSDVARTAEMTNAMKISAALSFSSPVVQASFNFSKETQSASSSSSQTSNMSKALSWEAVGGDTTLCNNPPAWSSTVKPFKNWRVINQKDVMAIAEFIGTFDGYEKIPEMFKMISNESAQRTPCRFLLEADPGHDGSIKGNQYYGLRNDKGLTKNEGMFDTLRKWCLDEEKVVAIYGSDDINKSADNAKYKFRQDTYTNGWHEWVGIDPQSARTVSGGCIFELDVETQLGRPPRLTYNTPYKLYNKATRSYLAADVGRDARIGGRTMGLLFYTRSDKRIGTFMFLKANQPGARGTIDEGANVSLHLCDDNDVPIGQVKRNVNDASTLGVELNDCELPFLFTTNNSYMRYDESDY